MAPIHESASYTALLLSVCPMYIPNARTENYRKPKIDITVVHVMCNLRRRCEVKSSRSQGQLIPIQQCMNSGFISDERNNVES